MKKHRWKAITSSIKQGSWCPICKNINNKHSIEDCDKLAINKNGKCITRNYIDNKTKMEWECEKGHKWFAPFISISGGRWCPHCSNVAKHTIEECHNIAKNMGGQCLESLYKNEKVKMEWMCCFKHIWSAAFGNIIQGSWCPICSFKGKTQKKLFDIIKEIFPNYSIFYNFKEFDWLINKNGKRQELDIYVKELKLAIEYDGEQHFKPMRYKSKKEMLNKLENTKKLDKLKNQKVSDHPENVKYFVRFNYKEKITKKYVLHKLSLIIRD